MYNASVNGKRTVSKMILERRYKSAAPGSTLRSSRWTRRIAGLLNAALKPTGLYMSTRADQQLLETADQYGYYWYNAAKKRDIRLDEHFGPLAAAILEDGKTYLSYDRLYTLWQGLQAVTSAKFAVAEIGTFKGGSAKFIAEALRRSGRRNRFYVCDTFEGHAAVDPTVDGKHQVGVQFKSSVERVRRYLKSYKNIQILAGDIMVTAAQIPTDEKFALVHIDVDVYPPTRFCLEFFGPRLVRGGVMVMDDYGTLACVGVEKAVEEFVAANPGFRRFHLMTGQAILVRTVA